MFDLCLRPTWRANSSHHYICSSYFSTPQRFCPQKSQVFSSAQSIGHCDLPKRKCVLCQTPLNMCLRFLPSSTIRNIDSQSSQPPLTASWKTQWPKLSSSTNSIMEDTASQSSQLPLTSEPCQKICPRLPIFKTFTSWPPMSWCSWRLFFEESSGLPLKGTGLPASSPGVDMTESKLLYSDRQVGKKAERWGWGRDICHLVLSCVTVPQSIQKNEDFKLF